MLKKENFNLKIYNRYAWKLTEKLKPHFPFLELKWNMNYVKLIRKSVRTHLSNNKIEQTQDVLNNGLLTIDIHNNSYDDHIGMHF